MKGMKLFFLLVIIALASGAIAYFFLPHKATVRIFPWDLKDSKSFVCTSRLANTFFPNSNFDKHTYETIDGQLHTKNDTKLAVQIEGKMLKMLTTTAVEIGIQQSAEFPIVYEDDKQLIAAKADTTVSSKGIYTFVLNKKNGIAIWTQTTSTGIGVDQIPDAEAYYMECR